MKLRNRKQAYILLSVLTILVISLSIAYTALSSTLKINVGKVTQSAQTWNVGFVPATNVTASTVGGTSATGRSCGTINVTATTVTVADTQLSKPGDYCTWHLQVKNSGSINAVVTAINPIKPASTTCSKASGADIECGNIKYKLAAAADIQTLYQVNSNLNAGATKNLYLFAAYTTGVTSVNSTAVTQSGAGFQLVYGQK